MDRVILASYFQEQARLHAGIPKSKITENSKNMLTAAAARQLTNYRQQAMIWIDDEIRAAAYKGKTNTYIEIVLPNSGMHEWIYNNLIEVKTSLQGREFIVNTAVRSLPATLQMSIYW
jgi:hypothetical protein